MILTNRDVITFYFNGMYSPIITSFNVITFYFVGIHSTIYEHHNNKKNTSVCV